VETIERHLKISERWLTKKQKEGIHVELTTAREYIERNISWKY